MDGLPRLERFLASCWARAGVPAQDRPDCTQAALEAVLGRLGPAGLEAVAALATRGGLRARSEDPAARTLFRAVWTTVRRHRRGRRDVDLMGVDRVLAPVRDHRLDDVLEAVAALPPREACLIRFGLLGYGVAEAAAYMGMTDRAAYNARHKALGRLRESLAG